MAGAKLILSVLLILGLTLSFAIGYYFAGLRQPEEAVRELKVVDGYGRAVSISRTPLRIISLAPSVTETLYVIGVSERVVAVDDFSDYPEEARAKPKIGSYLDPDLEKIIALKPDLILASDITSREMVSALEQRGLTVFVLAPKTLGEVIRDIRLVGLITGNAGEANAVAEKLEQRINAVVSKISESGAYRPRVYLEYYPYWTFGPGSFGHDLILMAGGRNLAEGALAAYPQVSDEFIVGSNPEMIIFTVGPHAETTVEDIRDRPGWRNTEAVRNGRIYTIDDDILSRPGPRLVDALEQLAKMIHPELFA
jgi:iron complex transport system substrate-binding protein